VSDPPAPENPGLELVSHRPLSPDEEYWMAVGQEGHKHSLTRLNDAIGRLLTLTTALTGGAVLWLKEVCPDWARFPAIGLFVAALGLAVWAAIPHGRERGARPADILASHHRALSLKALQLHLIGLCLWLGFVVASIGGVVVWVRSWSPPTPS
jgi:hypothetical protein